MDIEKIKKQVEGRISAVDFTDFCSMYENRKLEDGEYVFILNDIKDSPGLFNIDISFDEKTDDTPSRLWFDFYGPYDDSEEPVNVPVHSSKGWTDTGVCLSYDEFINRITDTIGELISEVEDGPYRKKVSVTFTAKFDVYKEDIDKLKKLEHHVEGLFDLDSWPEIRSVYDVHVNTED